MDPFHSKDAIVVQKYGGTSVGSPHRIRHVANRISRLHLEGRKRTAIVVSAMSGETNRLVAFVNEVNPNASELSYDMTVAAGEQISVGLLCAALEHHQIKAVPLLGIQLGIKTDGAHSRARIRHIPTEKIEACWNQNAIPVIAGFQGVTENLSITTLGRGGSDTSAVALAVALKADFCEINTDVSGVYSADPRVIPSSKLIERIDYASCLELAVLGGKVLHPRCVELAAKYRMPLVVRSTFDDDNARRTIVNYFNEKEALEAPVVSAVSIERNIAKFTVQFENGTGASLSHIFKKLSDSHINIDIIVYDQRKDEPFSIGFSVMESDVEKTKAAFEQWGGGRPSKIETEKDLAKVSVLGLGMQTHSGVASRIFETLHAQAIKPVMVTTSEIKVSCVVPSSQVELAAQALHRTFLES